nr:MAG TPA: hypothetical protein [Bacteriophage sp.]
MILLLSKILGNFLISLKKYRIIMDILFIK